LDSFVLSSNAYFLILICPYNCILSTLVAILTSAYQNKSIKIAYLSLIAVWKQFYGYGTGFMKSYYKIIILKQKPQVAFPELFLKCSMTKIVGLTGVWKRENDHCKSF
jgi:hypothetical protein